MRGPSGPARAAGRWERGRLRADARAPAIADPCAGSRMRKVAGPPCRSARPSHGVALPPGRVSVRSDAPSAPVTQRPEMRDAPLPARGGHVATAALLALAPLRAGAAVLDAAGPVAAAERTLLVRATGIMPVIVLPGQGRPARPSRRQRGMARPMTRTPSTDRPR